MKGKPWPSYPIRFMFHMRLSAIIIPGCVVNGTTEWKSRDTGTSLRYVSNHVCKLKYMLV
jgi:4-hydroxy-3-methylbut-2-en-1-yl diphosphate synthase IspG/GcpE